MSFADKIKVYNWDAVKSAILTKTADDVRRALYTDKRTHNDLLALLSPAAESFIEDMAQQAHRTTLQRFGKIIQMYAPLYVSNKCTNSCLYCGFNRTNKIDRKTLTEKEVMQEAETIYNSGFRHILLVSGEAPADVPVSYFCSIAQSLKNLFSSISIEIYPLDTDEYRSLIKSGVDGLTVYQETYNRTTYQQVHPAGKKRDYSWRLMTPDRGGTAGFRRINIGALLGLSDWRVEGAFTGLHAAYLMRQYWQSHISISFPRLRPATGGYEPEYPVNDSALVQLICAFRLFLPDAGLTELKGFFTAMLKRASGPEGQRGCMICNTAIDLAPHDESVATAVRGLFDELTSVFTTALTNAQAAGDVNKSLDPKATAELLVGLLQGAAVFARTGTSMARLKRYCDSAMAILE